MAKTSKNAISEATKTEALKIARATQKTGQSKEQTKLIAQGIQKGIDQYKKQQKAHARELDKQRKKDLTRHARQATDEETVVTSATAGSTQKLPWVLLVVSWALFAVYLLQQAL